MDNRLTLLAGTQKWSTKVAEALAKDLDDWRKSLPAVLQWDDSEPPAEEINAARIRAKYWGAMYVIHRPFLHHAIHAQTPQRSATTPDDEPTFSVRRLQADSREVTPGATRVLSRVDSRRIETLYPTTGHTTSTQPQNIRERECRICVEAAMQSTVAFDGVRKYGRPIVTNIFGTAHAYVSVLELPYCERI